MKVLEERYGEPENITNAFIRKALDWLAIKDNAKSLDEFAVFFTECYYAASNIQAVGILNYSENVKRFVAKLPFYMYDRWRNIAQLARQQEKIVKFSDFVEFIRRESRKLSDPVYGKEALNGVLQNRSSDTSLQPRQRPQRTAASYGTNLKSSNQNVTTTETRNPNPGVVCPCCGQTDWLSTCIQFERSFMEEKVDLL